MLNTALGFLVAILLLNVIQKLWAPSIGFTLLSSCYDPLMCSFERETLNPLRVKYVAYASGRVLDFGCGTGNSLEHFSAECSSIVLLDQSSGMLNQARQKAKILGKTNVEFILASGSKLPFENCSFDSIVSCDTLCSVSDQEAVVSELARVLKPGGKAIFVEHFRTYKFWSDLKLSLITILITFPFVGSSLIRETDKVLQKHFKSTEINRHAQSFRGIIAKME